MDLPPELQKFLADVDSLKGEYIQFLSEMFLMLDKETACRWNLEFPAYASVSSDDISFLSAMLALSAEKKNALKKFMFQQETIGAEEILSCLASEEVKHWVNVRNRDYSELCRKPGYEVEDSFKKFSRKFLGVRYDVATMIFYFFITTMIYPQNEKGELTLSTERFTPEEVDLFLLFKYVLTPPAQTQVLNKLSIVSQTSNG